MATSKKRKGVKSKQNRQLVPLTHSDILRPQRLIRSIEIKNVIPEDVPIQYSDNLLIQHRDGLFTIYWMQNQHPVLLTQKELDAFKTIESVCVARIMTTPLQLAKNLQAIEGNFNKFLATIGSQAKDYREFLKLVGKDDDEDFGD